MATNSSYKTISTNAPKQKGSNKGKVSPTQPTGKSYNPGGVSTDPGDVPSKEAKSPNLG
jgi:hypothetical protein